MGYVIAFLIGMFVGAALVSVLWYEYHQKLEAKARELKALAEAARKAV